MDEPGLTCLNFINADKYELLTACQFLSGLPCVYAGDKHLSYFYDYSILYHRVVLVISIFYILNC